VKAYVYRAALWCEECGEEVRRRIDAVRHLNGLPPIDTLDERTYDSDDYPNGPYDDGGGEADSPWHCDKCQVFLRNPLTSRGEEYLTEMLVAGQDDLSGVAQEWCERYDRNPEAPYFNTYGHFMGRLPDECVAECSEPNGQSAEPALRRWRTELNFKVPRDQAIDYLVEYGCWDREEMEAWLDSTLAETVLWVACGNQRDERDHAKNYPDDNPHSPPYEWVGLVH
jgi:hypothetical protein